MTREPPGEKRESDEKSRLGQIHRQNDPALQKRSWPKASSTKYKRALDDKKITRRGEKLG